MRFQIFLQIIFQAPAFEDGQTLLFGDETIAHYLLGDKLKAKVSRRGKDYKSKQLGLMVLMVFCRLFDFLMALNKDVNISAEVFYKINTLAPKICDMKNSDLRNPKRRKKL